MEAVILTSWDHIIGPQIEKLWFLNDNSLSRMFTVSNKILRDFNLTKSNKHKISDDANLSLMKIYSLMCGQLLLGEVDAYRTVDEWSSRLYLSENKILLAVLFHLNFWKCVNSDKDVKNVCLCFGIFFKLNIHNIILYNHLLIDQRVRKTASSLKNSKFLDDPCLKDVTALVEGVSELIESIKKYSLKINLTHNLPLLQNCTNFDFITQAVVSHLQTSGHTVVIGSSKFYINKIIHLLTLYSPVRKYKVSSITSQFYDSNIIGLILQDNFKDIDKSSKFLIERAKKDLRSLTVVDLNSMKVWQTIQYQDSFKVDKSNFSLMTQNGYYVPELMGDILFIENNKGDCGCLIDNFKEELLLKTCALIKTVEKFKFSEKFFSKTQIMTMHSIKNSADFHIILGIAETIKPGIRSLIM